MAQWWERSPPTGVARFQILASTPYVGWVLLLVFSLAPRGFSPGTPVFPSPQNPTLPNSNSTRNQAETKNHLVDVLPPNHYLLFMHVQKFCFTNPIRFLCRSRCCRRCSVLVEPPSSRLNKTSHSESLSSVDSHDSEWNFIPGVAIWPPWRHVKTLYSYSRKVRLRIQRHAWQLIWPQKFTT